MKPKNGICIAGVFTAMLATFVASDPAQGQTCALAQECGDVDDSGSVSSSDALRVLRKAVGQPQAMSCSCGEEEPPPPTCGEGDLKVTLSAEAPVPAEAAGLYDVAFDCAEAEGGSTFDGIDFTHCYRKADGSSWRIWNTGCGWQIGRVEGCSGWQDYARTWSGTCELPPEELDERALTTDEYFNNFGDDIEGVSSGPCTP
jgi:hypothetical protein